MTRTPGSERAEALPHVRDTRGGRRPRRSSSSWCEPATGVKILDVATGGGHVARRLREQGAQVVTCDAAPGMQPDVIMTAEHLPFADGRSTSS